MIHLFCHLFETVIIEIESIKCNLNNPVPIQLGYRLVNVPNNVIPTRHPSIKYSKMTPVREKFVELVVTVRVIKLKKKKSEND